MKILGTNFFLSGNQLTRIREFGYRGSHNQFRIICKCKSMADANRKCEAFGFGEKVFKSNWCCETGNQLELELCIKADVWVSLDGTRGNNYISAKELIMQTTVNQ